MHFFRKPDVSQDFLPRCTQHFKLKWVLQSQGKSGKSRIEKSGKVSEFFSELAAGNPANLAGRLESGTEKTSPDPFPWQPLCCHGNTKKLVFGAGSGLIDPKLYIRDGNTSELIKSVNVHFSYFDISDSKPLATMLDDGSGTNEVSSTNRLNDTLDENEMSAPIDTSMESLNEASQLDNTVSAWIILMILIIVIILKLN